MPHCNDYKSDKFTQGQPLGMELCTSQGYGDQPPSADQLRALQLEVPFLKRLENAECIKAFGSNFQHDYRSAILVSDLSNKTDSVLAFVGSNNLPWAHTSHGSWGYDSYSWMCNDWRNPEAFNVAHPPSTWICNVDDLISRADAWQQYDRSAENDAFSLVDVDYYLVEAGTTTPCSVNSSGSIIVIIFKLLKFICFVFAMKLLQRPLTTIGDAIESFLQRPDPTSSGFGVLSALDIRSNGV